MANLLDYLDWRGDLSFTASPFNDVDNLLFSMLAFVDLSGIVPESVMEGPVKLSECSRRFFEKYPEGIQFGVLIPAITNELFRRSAASPRYSNVYLTCYRDELDEDYVSALLDRIPGKNVLLTGVGFTPDQTGFALRSETGVSYHFHSKVGKSYSGTGDIFASAFCGAVASGKDLMDAGRIAAQFTLRCIENTAAAPAHWYGVKFETALPELIDML